jgi:hypothetical protein
MTKRKLVGKIFLAIFIMSSIGSSLSFARPPQSQIPNCGKGRHVVEYAPGRYRCEADVPSYAYFPVLPIVSRSAEAIAD